jgi:hypothetical protein
VRKLGGGRDVYTNHLCERKQWYFPKQTKKRRMDHVAASIIGCFGAPAPSPSDVNEMLASIGEMHRDLGCLEVSPLVASCALRSLRLLELIVV